MLAARKLGDTKKREFEFTDKDFNYIQQLVADSTGIVLSEGKRDMVYSRLARRIRELKLNSYKLYCDRLKNGDEDELIAFTNAITTNLTSFFREPHHFDFLKNKLLPEIKKNKSSRKLRVWSAGCSSGEEPYSIAMVVYEVFETVLDSWDIKILATDLDSNMVQTAANGVYTDERVTGLAKSRLNKFVKSGSAHNAGKVKMSPKLQNLITFKELNLMNDWPIKGPFDFMFCRNVVIYFDKPTQKILFDRYADLLAPNAHLFIGHSESLHNVTTRFNLLGKTIYQKQQ
ncbi:Chemotaxis protein methyltransferase CheR [hydrothermal vent metagenome]|uniref:protein-glutamate O-methyltransferase n=1 Tax=hydrothermal vent metagenome TaxID=652676 RepID=A0A3B0ZKN8_9ZZZZ